MKLRPAEGLPEFTLRFVPEGDKGPENAGITEIEVYRGGDSSPWQVLRDCAMEEPPYRGAVWVRTEDLNFDGYADLQMMRWWGVTGREGYCVWIFDPASGRFKYNEAFDFGGVGGFGTIDKSKKTLRVRDNERGAGSEYTLSSYKVVNNAPVLIEEEEQRCVDGQLKHTWYAAMKDGTLAETRTTKAADPNDWCSR
jgi:hypothetical protein